MKNVCIFIMKTYKYLELLIFALFSAIWVKIYVIIIVEVKLMIKTIGKVIDISIPEQYKNGGLLDIMDRTNIHFKVMTDSGLKEITVQQNDENTDIIINDMVEIIEQNISGKDFVDIRLYSGDNYE